MENDIDCYFDELTKEDMTKRGRMIRKFRMKYGYGNAVQNVWVLIILMLMKMMIIAVVRYLRANIVRIVSTIIFLKRGC